MSKNCELMNIRVLTNFWELSALRPAWESLESGSFLPMQDYIWARACASNFAPTGTLRMVVIQDQEQVVAIAPLVYSLQHRALEWLGVSQTMEPAQALCASEKAMPLLAQAMAEL